MNISTLERHQLTEIIKDILVEDPTILLEAIRSLREGKTREERFDAIMEEDFNKYDEVFKALA